MSTSPSRGLTRRQALALGAATAVGLPAIAGAQSGAPTKLMISYPTRSGASWPLWLARSGGYYAKYGLEVETVKTAGWAVARDKSLAGEYDASHMLSPMHSSRSMQIFTLHRSPMVNSPFEPEKKVGY